MKITSIAKPKPGKKIPLNIFLSPVQAGFPSPAEEHIDKTIDLNELLIRHKEATFFVRVEGESMQDANIHTGDVLIIDRSLEAKPDDIILAVINGEFTVKRLVVYNGEAFLQPENPRFAKMKIEPDADFQVWGVVTYVIHKAK